MSFPMYQRNAVPSSPKVKKSSRSTLHPAWPRHNGSTILQYVQKHPLSTVAHLWRPESPWYKLLNKIAKSSGGVAAHNAQTVSEIHQPCDLFNQQEQQTLVLLLMILKWCFITTSHVHSNI